MTGRKKDVGAVLPKPRGILSLQVVGLLLLGRTVFRQQLTWSEWWEDEAMLSALQSTALILCRLF